MSIFRRSNPRRRCVRCSHPNLLAANFCSQCGLMLVSHLLAVAWMNDQRTMLDRRRQLGDGNRRIETDLRMALELLPPVADATKLTTVQFQAFAHKVRERGFFQ